MTEPPKSFARLSSEQWQHIIDLRTPYACIFSKHA